MRVQIFIFAARNGGENEMLLEIMKLQQGCKVGVGRIVEQKESEKSHP